MSESKIERLVSMINQIALNMSANGDDQMVADQVAQHLEKFWSPPMKNLITEQPSDADLGSFAYRADCGSESAWLCRTLSEYSHSSSFRFVILSKAKYLLLLGSAQHVLSVVFRKKTEV